MPICPWCRTQNPAFPQDPDPANSTSSQANQPPEPPPQPENPTVQVKSTQENPLVTPAVQQLVYAPQPPQKPKSLPKRTNLGQFGQSQRSVTTTPVVGTHISQARVFSQQQAPSASSKPPQFPAPTTATINLSQTQNTPVELFDIVWRFYIIDYDVDPPHRSFTNITPWPANATLRETYEDKHIDFFDHFIEMQALDRVHHSGSDWFTGETYNTMLEREFKARGIKERLQIYRKVPSEDDKSEITSSWNSFKDKRLSTIVLQANETFYKPIPKGSRKAQRTVDYYVFDVGIVRETLVREPSIQPESLTDIDYSRYFTPEAESSTWDEFRPGNPGSDINRVPNSQYDDQNLPPSDDDAESVHTVSSKLTNLSLRVSKARDKGREREPTPPSTQPSTSEPVPTMTQEQGNNNRKRAVSGTAATSSSKRVISRRQAPQVASNDSRYQTRSKDQKQ